MKSEANAPETTSGHVQKGVMTELITLKNARDAKLYEVMVEASKIPGRFYRNLGPCDILSIALEIKEPPGRARGIGVNVPHKRAFTLTKEERINMKKARSEMKQNALYERLKKEICRAV